MKMQAHVRRAWMVLLAPVQGSAHPHARTDRVGASAAHARLAGAPTLLEEWTDQHTGTRVLRTLKADKRPVEHQRKRNKGLENQTISRQQLTEALAGNKKLVPYFVLF